jgi:hypothetical protein
MAEKPAGWYPDPKGKGKRYWDGDQWHESLVTGGRAKQGFATLVALLVIGLVTTGAVLGWHALSGPHSACERASSERRPSHACYVEQRKSEHETQEKEEEVCGPGGHFNGFLSCGNREADERREFREGWEEAEKEADFYGR